MQLITNKEEPENVGIHNLMVALVLSRKGMTIGKKMEKIIQLVSF